MQAKEGEGTTPSVLGPTPGTGTCCPLPGGHGARPRRHEAPEGPCSPARKPRPLSSCVCLRGQTASAFVLRDRRNLVVCWGALAHPSPRASGTLPWLGMTAFHCCLEVPLTTQALFFVCVTCNKWAFSCPCDTGFRTSWDLLVLCEKENMILKTFL